MVISVTIFTTASASPSAPTDFAALVYGMGFGAATLLGQRRRPPGAKRVMPIAFLATGSVYVSMALFGGSFTALLIAVFLWGLANHFGLNVLIMRLSTIRPGAPQDYHGFEQCGHVSCGISSARPPLLRFTRNLVSLSRPSSRQD